MRLRENRPSRLLQNAGDLSRRAKPGAVSDAAARRWLLAIAVAGLAIFCVVLVTADSGSGLIGLFGRLVLALEYFLVFVGAGGLVLVGAIEPNHPDPIHRTLGKGPLGPVLGEVETVRRLAKRLAFRRSLWIGPLGVCAACVVCWLLVDDPVWLLPYAAIIGGGLGYGVASLPSAYSYARLYKARVVPMLIGTSSELRYQRPPKAQLQPLQALFRFDRLRGDDALVGNYRGLAVVIAQVRASRRRPLLARTITFEGLVVEVALSNRLSGETIISPAATGPPHGRKRLERVGLEDQVFESAYNAYSDDQVTARALLTPDFMERFRGLDRRGRFGQPLCLGFANQLFVALPTPRDSTIFTPPDFDKQAGDADLLAQLKEDFIAVLRVIDSVIDLDSRTRMEAAPAAEPPPARRAVPRREGWS